MSEKINKEQDQWLQLRIVSPLDLVDSISDFLVGIIGAAVEVGVDEGSEKRTINGFLERKNLTPAQEQEIFVQVEEYLRELGDIFKVAPPHCTLDHLCGSDWANNWKQFFTPFQIIPQLTIAPTWENYQPGENENLIVMDPGMAFGTGQHPTTTLSIRLIAEVIAEMEGGSVLDVGTGTGILAMAALRLGGETAVGIDNDPEAVRVAKENVLLNGLQDKVEITGTDLSDVGAEFDLVIANIVFNVLQDLHPSLLKATRHGGKLILSGILADEQLEQIIRFFTQDQQLMHQQNLTQGEWAAVLFTKK